MNKRKAIHEASDNGSQATKRVRVSRACDQCRAGREKCDGHQPTCHTCETQKRPCSYDEQPKKRGIQPNYIRTLELSLSWLFRTFPGKENRLAKLLADTDGEAHRLIAFRDPALSDELHKVWRGSIISRQIEQLLSGAEIEAPNASDATDSPDEAHAAGAAMLQLAEAGHTIASPLRGLKDAQRNSLVDSASASVMIALPPESWTLLEHYFAFTHSWLPIIEKHDILRLMYTYPAEGLSAESVSGSEHAELWSIMALAAYQMGSSVTTWQRCRTIAKSLAPTEKGPFKIGHVKALLVLSLLEIMLSSWSSAWIETGSAIRMLAYLNATEDSSRMSTHRAKHVCLAAFLIERLVASRTGARMYLHSSQVHNAGPLVEDGLEEWAPWHDPHAATGPNPIRNGIRCPARAISSFNALIRAAASPRVGPFAVQDGGVDDVLCLLNNASAKNERIQPAILVSRLQTRYISPKGTLPSGTAAFEMLAQSGDAVRFNFWDGNSSDAVTTPLRQDFVSTILPDIATEANNTSTPVLPHTVDPSPGLWMEEGIGTGAQSLQTINEQSTDIFEELAMLERAESSSYPDFMENLGFGPDLDLAEFFGPEYLASESLLTDGFQTSM